MGNDINFPSPIAPLSVRHPPDEPLASCQSSTQLIYPILARYRLVPDMPPTPQLILILPDLHPQLLYPILLILTRY